MAAQPDPAQRERRFVWIVMCDDGNSQVAEIDIDSVWADAAEADKRKSMITNARRVWVESRVIGEIGVAYV